MKLVGFTQYTDDNSPATIHVNPEDVSAVKPWKYHSFREPIAEIVLKNGTSLHVWQDVESVCKRLLEA